MVLGNRVAIAIGKGVKIWPQEKGRKSPGLLPVIFLKFVTELWPLIDIRLSM